MRRGRVGVRGRVEGRGVGGGDKRVQSPMSKVQSRYKKMFSFQFSILIWGLKAEVFALGFQAEQVSNKIFHLLIVNQVFESRHVKRRRRTVCIELWLDRNPVLNFCDQVGPGVTVGYMDERRNFLSGLGIEIMHAALAGQAMAGRATKFLIDLQSGVQL